MKHILALDGGGIRGLLPARLLQAMQESGCYPEFDMIAGNSTGGILACGLVAGVSAKNLASLYSQHGEVVFERRLLGGISRPKYSASALESFLQAALGKKMLSDAKPELLVPSYCIDLKSPLSDSGITEGAASWFFKSWEAKSGKADDVPLWQVARATSAAPTFFPTAELKSGWFIDGGVFANNPALCAYADAVKLWPGERIKVLSIGTGSKVDGLNGPASVMWGAIGWASEVASVFMDGMADSTTYVLNTILGPDLLRCQIELVGVDDAFDDASESNIANLESLAKVFAAQSLPKIKEFLT